MAGIVDLDLGGVIKEGVGFLDGVLDKIAPDKMSEGEKEEYRLKYQAQMQGHLTTAMNGFYDLVKTQMSSKINIVVDTFRGLIRPVITLMAWGFYCWIKWILVTALHDWYVAAVKVLGADQIALVREFAAAAFSFYDFLLLSTIVGFWFGGRELQRYMARAMDTDVKVSSGGVIEKVKKVGWLKKLFGG